MAQDGSHDHQDITASSDEHSLVPPTTTTFVLDPTENDSGGSSRIGSPVGKDANKGKDVVPNAMEGGELGSDSGGKANTSRSERKNSAAAAIAAADAAADGLTTKGKDSLAAADDDGEFKGHLSVERQRRRRMKELFSTLRELMPHVPKNADKATLVGDAIDFIRSLEKTKAQLEKQRQQQVLARQAAAEAGASSSLQVPPRTAHGMAALSDGWGPAPQQQAPAAAGPPVEFRTWSTPNVVLSLLTNGEAVINVCAPRQPRVVTMVVSVLKKHGIDVVSMQIGADTARTVFTIYTRQANGAGGENTSAEEMYKLAVSEIMVWLSS